LGVEWRTVFVVVAAILVVAAGVVVLVSRQRSRRATPPAGPQTPVMAQQIAVVVNPSKEGAIALVATVKRMCAERSLPRPIIFETTVGEPGGPQALAAVAAGADVVVAAGGDGTVRAVASAMVGSRVPMGIIPVGTGNLLARNLDLPLTSVADGVGVVMDGRDRHIDIGRARVVATDVGPDGVPRPGAATVGDTEVFLVIAGLGFDAAMVVDTVDTLKRRVGWIAYFLAGMRHLHERRMKVSVWSDDRPEVTTKLRSILVGNCGKLPGGVLLLPHAVIDDGVLDVAGIDTRGGIAGWAQLLVEVLLQGTRIRNNSLPKIGRIRHSRARKVRIRVDGPAEHAQVDGDPLGRLTEIETWVEPGALLVRTA
jgi:diacylglycerol kinase family enzyme